MNMTIYDYDMSLILKDKKYYILGCGDAAREFAVRLLNSGIYFHGFLSLSGILKQRSRLWNKPVINVQECILNQDIMIITSCASFNRDQETLEKYQLGNRLVKFEILNPAITSAPDVVIYGTGSQGEDIFKEYSDFMDISWFCNSNERYWGQYFCGKEILSPQELAGLPKDTIVIIASNAYQKIYEVLMECNIGDGRIYCVENGALRFCEVCEVKTSFLISKLMLLLQQNKNIVIYGEENTVGQVKKKFELLDLQGVETVGRKSTAEDGSIFQLAYYDWEGRGCLLADDINLECMETIKEMDIPVQNVYWLKNCDEYQRYDYFKNYKYVTDPTLGYSAVKLKSNEDESEYSGFVRYEYLDGSDDICTILTLGGSTTQSFFVRESPWSEFLSDLLAEKKIPHRIFCGGIGGYSNTQEFLKLIRDGIMLKPDIVLSYSGVNNTNWLTDPEYPFIHRYQKEIFSRLKLERSIAIGVDDISLSGSVNYGIKNQKYGSFDFWLLYERLMNSICRELSIRFKAYLQPILFSKPVFDEYDRELLLGLFQIIANTSEDMEEYAKDRCQKYSSDAEKAILFRKEMKKYEKIYSEWLVDFSHIMDNVDRAYMDEAHVYERGNQVIAEYIFESIQNEVYEVLNEKNRSRKE